MKPRCHPFDKFRIAAVLFLFLAGVAAGGCGESDGLPRQSISGSVTMDSEPLDGAWIEFRPEGPQSVTASGAPIEDGRYVIARSEGLVPGTYRVTISKAAPPDEGGPVSAPAAAAPAGTSKRRSTTKKAAVISPFGFAKQLIPARYNVRTELTAKVEEGKPNAFDYPLTSK